MKKPARQHDAVDVILDQWRRERPDLDPAPMGPIGRLKRCAALLEGRLEAGFASYDLSVWEFDMLAALRRSGSPYRLSPTELFSTLMVSSGTMTHRLKRLETRGWIERLANEEDARSMLVQLTRKGLALINRAVESHLDNERRLLAALPAESLAVLDAQLSALLLTLENPPEQPR
ncbi:MarR family transcriptional regulator [Herbaspirillum seropedicae]|uniref:MarR family transcription regulator protein n=1 Tax=Herbaspirillum seropedicae (strain SmR1) TaxID=757424 RepID=D8J0Y9_HERSS|nr:MarR family transcriptional regulator [Herbaspirillum seropedicae]ADJ62544.1 MarR family transcription regulator protein [Herbaspirillum seropedicae SmR1]AKN64658.1 MarR family transcriptional regulator [Herbaspirillum seropedicae]NQE30921.1 MarR family transcriptional regulator [Herbaspirillum seropedicae]UMU20597.1 MarR family transcriptional regulator [Herbaspirillum seropedicae]